MRYFEDIEPDLVVELPDRPVDREEALSYAQAYDPQPIHLDEAAGAASLLGGLSVSGWFTGCLGMRMLYDGFVREIASIGAPGIEEGRWMRPVRPGDTLSGTVTVLDTRPSASRPEMGMVRMRMELFNQDGDPVYRQLGTNFVLRRSDG